MNVAIVGMGRKLGGTVPFDEPGWEVWGMNHGFLYSPHGTYTHWFELHAPWQLKARREERLAWLREDPGFPVFVQRREFWAREFGVSADELPWMHTVPQADIVALLNGAGRPGYHASTFDWMLATALGAYPHTLDRVAVYGSDSMEIEAGEPRSARACFEYWCGVAEARGVRVDMYPGTCILRNYERGGGQYPWDDPVLEEPRPPGRWDAIEGTYQDLPPGTEYASADGMQYLRWPDPTRRIVDYVNELDQAAVAAASEAADE